MSFARFMSSVGEDVHPDRAVVELTLRAARDLDEEGLEEAIELCAIPRRFDADVIGVLRGRPHDTEGNERLLGLMGGYPFVRVLDAGGHGYHDAIREQLLERWREDGRRERFEAATRALVAYHEAVHERVRQTEGHAARVGKIVRRASRTRYAQLVGALERSLLSPLLEALQLIAELSAAHAAQFLEKHLREFEDRGRYGACRAFLIGAQGNLGALAGDPYIDALLRYWDGLLLVRLDQPLEAQEVLRPLTVPGSCDALVRYRALGELGRAQRSAWQLRAAEATLAEEVREAESVAFAPSRAASYLRLGHMQMLLERPQQARSLYRNAADAATRAGDVELQVSALGGLAEAELRDGDRRACFEHAMSALDLARTDLRHRRSVHAGLADTLGRYFADERVEVTKSIADEAESLLAGLDDPLRDLRRRVAWLSVFSSAGLLEAAARWTPKLTRELDQMAPRLRGRVLVEVADLDARRGRGERALTGFAEVEEIARAATLLHLQAKARQGRGRLLATRGQWTEAELEFRAAGQLWQQVGHDAFAAVSTADEAAAAGRHGDAEAAERLLADAERDSEQISPWLRLRILQIRGRHEAAAGDWERADTACRRALQLADALGSRVDAAEVRATWAECAELCARDEEARGLAAAARSAARVLREHDVRRRSDERKHADEQNAEGLRCLLSDDGAALQAARENFEGALSSQSDAWYRLNLAYAAAATGDYAAAATALSTALEDASWLDCEALSRRLSELRIARDSALLESGRFDEALRGFAGDLERLSATRQSDARRRCLLGVGECLRALRRPDEAIAAYTEALEAGAAPARLPLSDLLAEAGRRDEAIEVLRGGLDSDPEVVEAAAVALLKLAAGDGGEPTAVLDAVLHHGGESALMRAAERLKTAGSSEIAEQAYESLASAVPEATLQLARLHREDGRYDRSLEEYERARRCDDADVAGRAGAELAALQLSLGERDAAASTLRTTMAIPGARSAAHAALQLGELLLAEGKPEEANKPLRQAADAADAEASPAALVLLGDIALSAGREETAARRYGRALALADPELAAKAGMSLLALSGIDEDDVISRVLQHGARAGLALFYLLDTGGRRGAAERVLRRIADTTEDLYAPDAALQLGNLLFVHGRPEEARRAYHRALASKDATVVPQAALRLHYTFGEPAATTIEPVITAGGYASLVLGDELQRRGAPEAAERAFRRAAESGPYAAEGALSLGDLLAARGDLDGAKSSYQQAAISVDPHAARTAHERLRQLDPLDPQPKETPWPTP